MMKRLFKGGTVVSGEGLKKIDLLVKGEKILAAGKNLEFQDAPHRFCFRFFWVYP